jgi:hypothetical protein
MENRVKKVVIIFRNTVVLQTSLPSPITTLSSNIHDISSQPCQLQNSKWNNIQWQLTSPGHGIHFTLPDLPSQHLRFGSVCRRNFTSKPFYNLYHPYMQLPRGTATRFQNSTHISGEKTRKSVKLLRIITTQNVKLQQEARWNSGKSENGKWAGMLKETATDQEPSDVIKIFPLFLKQWLALPKSKTLRQGLCGV